MSGADAAATEGALGAPLLGRDGFDRLVGDAIESGTPFASGKLGVSERGWLMHPIVAERETDPRRLRAYEVGLAGRTLPAAGIFPADTEFLRRYERVFEEAVGRLDAVGIFGDAVAESSEIFRFHRLEGRAVDFKDQEPERSVPADDERCWLRHLRGRRVLLVCPFAEFLRERAERRTYEAVWSKIGKRWFEPASVEAVEFPYGYSERTQRGYGTALDLLDEIRGQVDARDYDVALVAAGGLGIPLAAHVKGEGRVGLSLGGHLQIVFGVFGDRWLGRPRWRTRYFNENWTRVPARYVPDPRTTVENYW